MARQVDDRLVVDDELVIADRVGKRTSEVALLVGLGEQVVVEKTNLGTGLFGGVHRRVGLTDKVGGIEVGAAAQHGDTDAGPAADPAGRLRRDRFDGIGDAAGEAERIRLADVGDDHHELVTAQPTDRVGGAHGRPQRVGHTAQKFIAGVMAVRVVDQFEPVEIEIEERNITVIAGGPGELVLEVRGKQCPVGEAGEWVLDAGASRVFGDAFGLATSRPLPIEAASEPFDLGDERSVGIGAGLRWTHAVRWIRSSQYGSPSCVQLGWSM